MTRASGALLAVEASGAKDHKAPARPQHQIDSEEEDADGVHAGENFDLIPGPAQPIRPPTPVLPCIRSINPSVDPGNLRLLKPGKLVVAAYPNFFPVCHYQQPEAKGSGVPSTEAEEEEEQGGSTSGGGCV